MDRRGEETKARSSRSGDIVTEMCRLDGIQKLMVPILFLLSDVTLGEPLAIFVRDVWNYITLYPAPKW